MPTFAFVDALEPRRHLTFAATDPNFRGGYADLGLADGGIYDPYRSAVTPLDDGRIVMTSPGGIRYLRGDGTPDPKRQSRDEGTKGLVGTGRRVIASAVDPATGRVATLIDASDDTPDSPGNAFTIEVRGANAKVVSTRTFVPQNNGVAGVFPEAVKIAFAGDDVLVLVRREASDDIPWTGGDVYADVYRYTAQTLAAVTSFGTDGVAGEIVRPAMGRSTDDAVTFLGFALDAAGRMYVRFEWSSEFSHQRESNGFMFRFAADGARDDSYGEDGVAALYWSDDELGTPSPYGEAFARDAVDVVVAPDGSLRAVLSVAFGRNLIDLRGTGFIARRYDTSGQLVASVDVGLARATKDDGLGVQATASIALDGGRLYVARRDARGGTMHLHRLDATTLAPDPKWAADGVDGAVATAKLGFDGGAGMLAVSRRFGRVLVGGTTVDGGVATLAAYIRPRESFDDLVPAGTVRRLTDGTLVVRGTSDDDRIAIDVKGNKVYAQINGRTTKFTRGGTRGFVLLGGDGADWITAGAADSVWVDGGADDDTIRGTGGFDEYRGIRGEDTLLGGIGDDRIDAGDGDDDVFGGDGNDRIVGGRGADHLFGHGGDDVIYGFVGPDSDQFGDSFDGDRRADWLSGGRGRDVLHTDTGDVLTDIDGEDDIHY